MTEKTTPFDAAEYIENDKDAVAFIAAAMQSGDGAHITKCLGIVARARGMSSIAKEAGVTREALYKALREDGDPKLSTLLGVCNALGISLSATCAEDAEKAA